MATTLLDQRALVAILAKKSRFAARNWMKTIRGLIKFAVATGLRKGDPTVGIKLPSIKSDGHHTWGDYEVHLKIGIRQVPAQDWRWFLSDAYFQMNLVIAPCVV